MTPKTLFAAAVALIATQVQAHIPSVPGCENTKTTVELIECRSRQMDAADAKLRRYLQAARDQAKQFDLDPSVIDAEQKAWAAYQTDHCGHVWERWEQGSIRYEMSANCTLILTHERTLDVWRAYLTYWDSTPPVLPEPTL